MSDINITADRLKQQKFEYIQDDMDEDDMYWMDGDCFEDRRNGVYFG